ncbi:MAG TPA: flavodoxin [Sedimentibacter sp.]|jgi:flavodoxin|nr:hypothetical protein [Sedimentibacter sp.]HNZ82364.1 flavodoxin [Sedimentibacter sp.]HOH69117.1 flavodoxin [Sedimentibacter sp.]HPW99785.1 flavodoxin [Sedimentibacter sp.]HQB63647.1 flavodoxin [Sedimentibacter sp.]
MKNLVVYYSRTGHTEIVAKEIAKIVKGDIKRIELKKKISIFWAGFNALTKKDGKIKPIDFYLEDYDNIFIGSPVWAGKTSTPINAFLSRSNFTGKNVYVFLTQTNKEAHDFVYESVSSRVKAKGGKVIDTFFIKTVEEIPLTPDQVRKPVEEWIKRII